MSETADLDALATELRDRFGAPPPEVDQLLALKRLRLLGRDAGVARLRVKRERLEFEFTEPLARPKALAVVAAVPGNLEFADSARTLRIAKPGDPVSLATNILRRLGPPASVSPPRPPAGDA
jgi:transcription-repair coupling factor (superfamily II helicase)